jgi:LVIVD repeat
MKHLLYTTLAALLLFSCTKADNAAELADQSGKSGSITRFAVYQQYMYVLNMNEMQTYDVSDKDHPVLVHELSTDYGLETITIYDNTIFLGSTTALYIIDITTNPAAPQLLSKSERLFDFGFSGCDPVTVKDNYAYSTIKIIQNICGTISAESALVVYDVTDKSNPIPLSTYPMIIPNGLGYKDNFLFVCDEGRNAVVIFDITDPKELVELPFFISIVDPYDLIIDGERMIVSAKNDFQIYDIEDITHMKKLASISK